VLIKLMGLVSQKIVQSQLRRLSWDCTALFLWRLFSRLWRWTSYVLNANSLDPGETPSNSASNPDPRCLTLRQHFHQFW